MEEGHTRALCLGSRGRLKGRRWMVLTPASRSLQRGRGVCETRDQCNFRVCMREYVCARARGCGISREV